MTEIGAHRKRVEDPRLLRGLGQYVDDLRLPGTLDVAFVRSTYSHARLTRVDLEAARAAPGVHAAWSGAHVRDLPRMPTRIRLDGLNLSPLPPLADQYVTLSGYPLAAVVAETRAQARDAAELVEVDYELLEPVTTAERALELSAPLLYPRLGSNVGYHVLKEGGDVAAAFDRADRTLELRIAHARLAPVPLEPRAILASYDRGAERLTVWRSTQSPFLTRSLLATVLGRDESTIRVIAPDVGGAFGAKSALYPDELTVVLLAMQLDVPLRWTSTRIEDLQFTAHGRDQVNEVQAAFQNDGTLDAVRVRCLHNLGGVLLHPIATPPLRVTDYGTGAYRTPRYRAEAFGVYTNTAPTGPYRGAGRPEAAMIAERVVEEVARALALDPVAVRRKNFLQPGQFPYTNAVGSVFDSGDYSRALDRLLEIIDYDGWRARQQQSASELVGLGIATTIEVSGQGQEFGSLEVEPDGTILARTGANSHGQGHETTFAQVVADALEVPVERVRVMRGDTDETSTGGGSGGSRSLVLGGSAMLTSARLLKDRALNLAAGLLEVGRDDLVFARGGVEVIGVPDQRLELGAIAAATPDRLHTEDSFKPTGDAVPFGATAAMVRIDLETGLVRLERLVAVDDCGRVVNPLIVHGQIAGGLAQGIAEALYEQVVFDDGGELLSSSLLDYAVPNASMLPDFELELVETPSPNNPLGAKGVGEAGCVAAPPAIVNAVLDALRPLGVTKLDMPLTPERIWQAIRAAG